MPCRLRSTPRSSPTTRGATTRRPTQTHGVSLKADYDFGGVTLTSITAWEHASGYSRGDTDGGAAANFGGVAPNICAAGCGESQGRLRGLDQWSQEVRLASDDTGRFKWQVGGIYFDSRDHTEFDQRGFFLTSNALGTAPNPNNWVLIHDVNTSWAAFGQASYELVDRLTLTGGVRVTKDTKTTDLLQHPGFAALAVPATAPASSYSCGAANYCRLSDTKPSWDVSLLYRATDEVSLYARVARGFRGPDHPGPVGGVRDGLLHRQFGDQHQLRSRGQDGVSGQQGPLQRHRLLL